MDPSEYPRMYQAEDTHWWYRGMAAITCALLNRCLPRGGALRILDAGCGTGAAMTTYLARYGRVWGVDIAAPALQYCRRRGAVRTARASVMRLPFDAETFDLVTSFDVLYEQAVPSELTALREIRRVLVPGGRLLLRLPAYSWMRRSHDAAVHTRRRYTRREMESLFRESGFRSEQVSYANMLLLPAALLRKLAESLAPPDHPRSDLTFHPGFLNGPLRAILSAEAPWIARAGLPCGLSVVGVGCKA
jgi:SAM-dependent methyltransferase